MPTVSYVCLQLGEVAANLTSLTGCLWMLRRLRSLPSNVGERLFPLQLRILAIADLIFLLACLPTMMINHQMVPSFMQDWYGGMCEGLYIVLRFGRNAAILCEVHIAFSFLAKAFRCLALQQFASALRVVFIVAAVPTLMSSVQTPFTFDAVGEACGPAKWAASADNTSTFMMLACITVCLISYVTVIIRSLARGSPLSVQILVFRQAEMYIVNALMTYGLVLAIYLNRSLFDNINLRVFAFTMENLGGLLNTLTYAMQSRYAPALSGNHRGAVGAGPSRPSFRVEIGRTVIEEIEKIGDESWVSNLATNRDEDGDGDGEESGED